MSEVKHTPPKLTPVQRRVLSGCIFEHFDVWNGYWFTSAEDGAAPAINMRTIDALNAAGLIERGENIRVASGRQRCPWHITETGRAALSSVPGKESPAPAVGEAVAPKPSQIHPPGTIRICPMRDGPCHHGLDCPFVGDGYSGYPCKGGWNAARAASGAI